jgi:hypothetical protein
MSGKFAQTETAMILMMRFVGPFNAASAAGESTRNDGKSGPSGKATVTSRTVQSDR